MPYGELIMNHNNKPQSRLLTFFIALMIGAFVAALLLFALQLAQSKGILSVTSEGTVVGSPLAITIHWVRENLKGSLWPFLGVLVLFLILVERLAELLKQQASIERLSQTEYMADLCTSLFFGIGVIWTAIGMRSALLAGLGGLDSETAAEVGAFAILQKLVDGGILLALSTTIVGGVGGYLMRVYKSLRIGGQLRQRYIAESKASENAVLEQLNALNTKMAAILKHGSSPASPAQSRLP